MIDIKYNEKQILKPIPKNVRQVGENSGRQRIYIEDYVVTYLNQLAHPTNSVVRGAVLLGERVNYEENEVLYISGALETDKLSFDLDEVRFDNEIWTKIYETGSQYFENVNIVGWFLSRLGYSTKLTEKMVKVHNQYFPENGSVLFLMDALEQEETFYIKRNGNMVRQPGYYIYYERNTAMQNYLVDHQNGIKEEQSRDEVVTKDEQLLQHYHKIMDGRKAKQEEKKVTNFLYLSSAVLTIVFLALGITIVNNYDKMKSVQQSLETLTSTATSEGQSGNLKNADAGNSPAETPPGSEDVNAKSSGQSTNGTDAAVNSENAGETTTVAEASGGDTVTADETGSTEENTGETVENTSAAEDTDAVTTAAAPESDDSTAATSSAQVVEASGNKVLNYYTVQQGDTLLSISQQIYHSGAYVNAIKKANEINENDFIYPGQQIVLPAVD